ncbi:efflux RND transporter periplasmic adaptor subunit [Beggiatoa alba]|nr:efflux RND transporter periplasmic adaptor subunit [Beggiatoa alba]
MPKYFKTLAFIIFLVVTGLLIANRSDDVAVVEVAMLESGPLSATIRATGRIINDRTVTLTALLDGQIQAILVHTGDKVVKGQILAKLDSREATALMEKSRALLAREQQSVKETAAKLKRLRNVSYSGGASKQRLEDVEAEWLAAKARLRVAKAELQVAAIHMEKIAISAPFSGVITEKKAEVGQWLEAGTPVFILVALAGREIEARLHSGDSGVIKHGQTVKVTCEAFPLIQWSETLNWIAPAIHDKTQANADTLNTFAVRISLGKAAPPLLLGQQLDVEILTAQREQALKLPFGALHENKGIKKVAVIRQGKVHFIEVKTGIEDLSHIEIIHGLQANETVILPGGAKLVEGQPVRVREL